MLNFSLGSQLPRDTRDTLFLLLLVMCVVAPQFEHMPFWASAATLICLVWRSFLAWHARPLPSRWWLLIFIIVAGMGTWWSYRTVLGQKPGVMLLVMMLALKTLELRARRDAMVIFFLCFFTILTQFFNSQSLLTALFILPVFTGLLAALINAHMPAGRPDLKTCLAMAARMLVLGIPITLTLFVLFPRLPPLWGIPTNQAMGRSGLSSEIDVGAIAELALDGSIVMRIRFDTAPPPQKDLYFRGPVLSSFDGRRWKSAENFDPNNLYALEHLRRPPISLEKPGVSYEVTLEPSNRPWLLALDVAVHPLESTTLEGILTSNMQWINSRPVHDLLRYKAVSYTKFRYGPQRMTPSLQALTHLPSGSNPRTVQLAQELRSDPQYAQADTRTLVNLALNRLATQGYFYTLAPGLFGEHSADEFWFDKKEGFCEHIASSFVILMRALGIPARMVTGYQGGELNAIDGYWVVRQSDAHAWTEVWEDGTGWMRVDPTSAVFPARTEQLQRLSAPTNALTEALIGMNPGMVAYFQASWEALNNAWNQKILNYSQSSQFNFLKHLGIDTPQWEHLVWALCALLIVGSVLGVTWTLWRKQHQRDPWLRLLHAAQERLFHDLAQVDPSHPRAHSVSRPPRALAQLSLAHYGESARALHDWLLDMESIRYGQHTSTQRAQTLRTLRQQWRRMEWPTRKA